MKFTDPGLRALQPRETRYDLYDDALPNFGVRVGKSRTLTFFVLYRDRGRKLRKTLGRFPVKKLADARSDAEKILHDAKYAPRSPVRRSYDYAETVTSYLKLREPHVSAATHIEYTRYLVDTFAFSGTLDTITTTDIAHKLDAISGQSSKAHGYRALKTFFKWCVERDYLEINPATKIKPPREPGSRDRVLDPNELLAIWLTLKDWPEPRYSLILKLLIATGQRAGQISRLHTSWIDYRERTITFPASAMKTAKAHVLPFGNFTQSLLEEAKPTKGFFFSPGDKAGQPFTAWSKNKAALDRELPIEHWTVHDLRRTWSTTAASLDTPPHITERILAHEKPSGPIEAVYNRFRYLPQMRDAMTRHEDFLQSLLQNADLALESTARTE